MHPVLKNRHSFKPASEYAIKLIFHHIYNPSVFQNRSFVQLHSFRSLLPSCSRRNNELNPLLRRSMNSLHEYKDYKASLDSFFENTYSMKEKVEGDFKDEIIEKEKFVVDVENMERTYDTRRRITLKFFMSRILWKVEAGLGNNYLSSNDYAMAAVLKGAGLGLSTVSSQKRTHFVKRIWQCYLRENLPVTADLFNLLMSIWLENGHIFDPWGALLEMKRLRLEPNADSYLLTAIAYCMQGDSIDALYVISKGRENGYHFDENVLQKALLYCHAYNGNNDELNNILKTMTKDGNMDLKEAYESIIRAYAVTKDIQKVVEILDQVEKADIRLDNYTIFKAYDSLSRVDNISDDNLRRLLNHLNAEKGILVKCTVVIDELISSGYFIGALHLLRFFSSFAAEGEEQLSSELCCRFINYMLVRHRLPGPDVMYFIGQLESTFSYKPNTLLAYALGTAINGKLYDFETEMTLIGTFVDTIDMTRKRPHILFPLMISAKSRVPVEEIAHPDNFHELEKAKKFISFYFEKGYRLPEKCFDQETFVCHGLFNIARSMKNCDFKSYLERYMIADEVATIFRDYNVQQRLDKYGNPITIIHNPMLNSPRWKTNKTSTKKITSV